LPINIIRNEPKTFRAYLKGWVWNIKNFKNTLIDRENLSKIKKIKDDKLIKLIIYDKYKKERLRISKYVNE